MARSAQEFRKTQIKRLWDKRFGSDIINTFIDFERSIPQIPNELFATDPDMPFLSLADPRLLLPRVCKRSGVDFDCTEISYAYNKVCVPFCTQDIEPTVPFWFRHDDGRKNRNRRVVECREEYTGNVRVGTALVGVFAFLHHPYIIKLEEHAVYLPGSVRNNDHFYCALLKATVARPVLNMDGSGSAQPNIGTLLYRLT